MKPAKKIRLNLLLSSGLYVISAKIKDKRTYAMLHLTDYIDTVKVLFDLKDGVLLSSNTGITMTKDDMVAIMKAIGG